MTDIDWLAVDMVCQGTRLAHLTPPEKKAAIRRLSSRMVATTDNTNDLLPHQLTAQTVAERLGMSRRNVERIKAELLDATERRCPVCGCRMWVLHTNVVEPHGNGIHEECGMSDRLFGQVVGLVPSPFGSFVRKPRGLAAVRPDLYGWLVPA